MARGAITAGGGQFVSCPGQFPNGNPRVLYAPLVMQAGNANNAIGSLAVYGAHAPVATSFDLNGWWTDAPGHGLGPFITESGHNLTVDMSAFGRPTATGTVLDDTHISVTFPDDRTYTGQLLAPATILWSNNTTWTKL
jgi:hypothetical protein